MSIPLELCDVES